MQNTQIASTITSSIPDNGCKLIGLPYYGIAVVDSKKKLFELQELLVSLLERQTPNKPRDSAWEEYVNETILFEHVQITDSSVVIPSLVRWPKEIINIHVYELDSQINYDSIINYAKKIKKNLLKPAKVIFENAVIPGAKTIDIFMKKIASQEIGKRADIINFSKLTASQKDSAQDLINQEGLDGFDFLISKLIESPKRYDALCAVLDDQIVGMFGPLTITEDALRNKMLGSAYFGIKENFRRRGYAKKLWTTALSWGANNDAEYVVAQNSPDSPAARFYTNNGLKAVGRRSILRIS